MLPWLSAPQLVALPFFLYFLVSALRALHRCRIKAREKDPDLPHRYHRREYHRGSFGFSLEVGARFFCAALALSFVVVPGGVLRLLGMLMHAAREST